MKKLLFFVLGVLLTFSLISCKDVINISTSTQDIKCDTILIDSILKNDTAYYRTFTCVYNLDTVLYYQYTALLSPEQPIRICVTPTESFEKYKSDLQHQQHENKNRENMLDTFQSIIKDHPDFNYLVEPLISLTDEIKNSISFSQYFLKDDVLDKLKKQRQNVKDEIVKAQMQLTRFSLDEKKKAIAIAEDGIKQ